MVWLRVTKFDRRALELADRHYPRQRPGARQFMPPGRTLVLLSDCGRAVWGVCENRFRGVVRWRVTIFRNEGAGLSSELIATATALTLEHWRGRLPGRLTTEVDPKAVRRKRDPGRCFIRAGWRELGPVKGHRRRGAIVFEAP